MIVAPVEVEAIAEEVDFIGQITAIEQVALRARVAGFIEAVLFEGGEWVEAGDLLVRIEPEQFEAAVAAAEARLAAARESFRSAERELARIRELRESGMVPEARLDEAQAAFEAARGDRLQAEAALRQAQLDLGYTRIEAPIDGRMSAPLITAGNYVGPTSGELALLTKMDPIWGVFPVSERQLVTWQRLGMDEGDTTQAGRTAEDEDAARADQEAAQEAEADAFVFHLVLPDGALYPHEGRLDFVDSAVNPSTGTVEARFTFPNPEGYLRPGQNVTLVAIERNPPRLPVVPQAAVQLSREGRSVLLVDENDRLVRRSIEVDPEIEIPGRLAVTEGLEGGETLVVRGALTLPEGTRVSPRRAEGEEWTTLGADRAG